MNLESDYASYGAGMITLSGYVKLVVSSNKADFRVWGTTHCAVVRNNGLRRSHKDCMATIKASYIYQQISCMHVHRSRIL